MNDANGYAVFFFPQALEALGEAIAPYLQDGPAGPHVVCNEIDTAGSLIEMTIRGTNSEGKVGVLELMVPGFDGADDRFQPDRWQFWVRAAPASRSDPDVAGAGTDRGTGERAAGGIAGSGCRNGAGSCAG